MNLLRVPTTVFGFNSLSLLRILLNPAGPCKCYYSNLVLRPHPREAARVLSVAICADVPVSIRLSTPFCVAGPVMARYSSTSYVCP